MYNPFSDILILYLAVTLDRPVEAIIDAILSWMPPTQNNKNNEVARKKRVYVDKRICKNEGCNVRSSYGKKGSKIREFCKKHAPVGYVNVVSKRCIQEECDLLPNYGKKGSNLREYCKEHAPTDYVDIVHKKCEYEDCNIRPTFGKKGSKLVKFCKGHAPSDYVNVIDKKCNHEGCDIQPIYGKEGSRTPEYCKEHAPSDYINVRDKTCLHTECNKQPCYGKKGLVVREYCKQHAPVGYVDVKNRNKICKHEGCTTRAHHGIKGSKIAEFCTFHSPSDYVNVLNPTCIYDNCNIQPIFGREGSKLREFCKTHAPPGYIDVNHTRCSHKDCNTTASYGTASLKISINITDNVLNELTELNKPTHCLKHKQAGMIFIRRCSEKNCKDSALYGIIKPIHCEKHKIHNDISLIERKCKQCGQIDAVDVNGLCWNNCIATTIYKKRQTVKQNKVGALLKREIATELYCSDKVIDSACTLRRPDFVYTLGSHVVIVEVDENAGNESAYHKQHSEDERVRMFEISNSFEGCPIIFIRYNPDNYHVDGKLKKTPDNQREITLTKWVEKAIDHKKFPKNNLHFPTVLTVYLYYNEYNESVSSFTKLSEDGLKDGLIPCIPK